MDLQSLIASSVLTTEQVSQLVGEQQRRVSERHNMSARSIITQTTSTAALTSLLLSPVTDNYAGFSVTGLTASPITRSLPPYTVQLDATSPANGFFFAGTTADPAVSTNTRTTLVTFSFPSGNVYGMGCFFYPSDINGLTVTLPAGSQIIITATDTNGWVVCVVFLVQFDQRTLKLRFPM